MDTGVFTSRRILVLTMCIVFIPRTTLATVYAEPQGFTNTNVKMLRAPGTLRDLGLVTVEYYCREDAVVVVDVIGMYQRFNQFHTLFAKKWICNGQDGKGTSRVKNIHIRMDKMISYRPDYFNKVTFGLRGSAKVRVWLVDMKTWRGRDQARDDIYYSASKRDYENTRVVPKYSRPFYSPEKRRQCAVWYWHLVQTLPQYSDTQICDKEEEMVTMLDYPTVFNGATFGIVRTMSIHKDINLETERIANIQSPKLTIEMWVYFLDFCPSQRLKPEGPSCGLIEHIDRTGMPLTPTLLISHEGNIQVDIKNPKGYDSRRTLGKATLNVWTKILFTLDARTWNIWVLHGETLDDGFHTTLTYDEDTFVDDVFGNWNLGGLDPILSSFVGYMGRVVMNRRRVLKAEQITPPSPYHAMYELHLSNRVKTCTNFMRWMDEAVRVYQRHHTWAMAEDGDVCPNEAFQMFDSQLLANRPFYMQCPMSQPYGLKHHRYIKKLLRKMLLSRSLHWNFLEGNLEAYSSGEAGSAREALLDISRSILDSVTDIVSRKSLTQSRLVLKLLKQAACLGNNDAMYNLASHLNNGLGCKVDEIHSLAFFMLGSLNSHMLSLMALGHRHFIGLDGAPLDKDIAFMYYKQVADKSRLDRIEHKEGNIQTETIRLTDEAKIDIQTSETGELFQWLKHQAEQGVASARQELGIMMFHGAQGLNRNLQRGLDMFRAGAEAGDPDAMFNAGIIEYRGIGGLDTNKTHGRSMIEKAAGKDNAEAVGALAWIAMEEDKNMTHAYELFQKAKKLGNPNAGYFLGHMYQFAMVPNATGPDLDEAVKQYWHSASRGNMDAGIVFSFIVSRGTSKQMRDINAASIWARFIAEAHCSALAKPFRQALNAYRDKNYGLALYLYLLLSSSGVETSSFNLAYLCEQNTGGITTSISKECQWRNYNLTVQREFNMVDAYSYIKMGDHYWYGCRGTRDLSKAANFYSLAAQKGDPHALFNLAFMVEEGAQVSKQVWRDLRIHDVTIESRTRLLMELYSRCRESHKSEAFIPCTLALGRVWCTDIFETYPLYMKISSFFGSFVVIASIVMFIVNCKKSRQQRRQDALQRRSEDVGRRKKEDDEAGNDVANGGPHNDGDNDNDEDDDENDLLRRRQLETEII